MICKTRQKIELTDNEITLALRILKVWETLINNDRHSMSGGTTTKDVNDCQKLLEKVALHQDGSGCREEVKG